MSHLPIHTVETKIPYFSRDQYGCLWLDPNEDPNDPLSHIETQGELVTAYQVCNKEWTQQKAKAVIYGCFGLGISGIVAFVAFVAAKVASLAIFAGLESFALSVPVMNVITLVGAASIGFLALTKGHDKWAKPYLDRAVMSWKNASMIGDTMLAIRFRISKMFPSSLNDI